MIFREAEAGGHQSAFMIFLMQQKEEAATFRRGVMPLSS